MIVNVCGSIDSDSGERPFIPLQCDSRFVGSLFDQSHLGLVGVERLEDLVHLLGLIVEEVFFGIFIAVAVAGVVGRSVPPAASSSAAANPRRWRKPCMCLGNDEPVGI